MANISYPSHSKWYAASAALQGLNTRELADANARVRMLADRLLTSNSRQPLLAVPELQCLGQAIAKAFAGEPHLVLFDDFMSDAPHGPAFGSKATDHDSLDRLHGLSKLQLRLYSAVGLAHARSRLQAGCWTIVIFDCSGSDIAFLRGAVAAIAETGARLLAVACSDNQDVGTPQAIAADNEDQIQAALEGLKASQKAGLLHLSLAASAWQAGSANSQTFDDAGLTRAPSMLRGAREMIARLAASDARIVEVFVAGSSDLGEAAPSAGLGRSLLAESNNQALALAGGLAIGGCQPFVLLSSEAVNDNYALLRKDICQRQLPVTLIVDGGESGASGAPDDALALLQLLPYTSVGVPADPADLNDMLARALESELPVAIWLGDQLSETANRPHAAGAMQGERAAEQPIAILTLGPDASAVSAARLLRHDDIAVEVVPSGSPDRFEEAIIACAADRASAVVIVDAQEDHGHFGAHVLEALAKRDCDKPVSLVRQPPTGLDDQHTRFSRFVRQIVDTCKVVHASLEQEARAVAVVGPSPVVLPVESASSESNRLEADENVEILAQQFSPIIQDWIRAYEEIGKRNVYLWKWCLHGLELTTLPCVLPALRSHLCDTKLLAVMLGVLLDDVADQAVDGAFLRQLVRLLFNESTDFRSFSASQQSYAQFTERLWKTIESRLKTYPQYDEFEELLVYDHHQIVNAMSYSCLVNRHLSIVNMVEHDAYLPHNMQMMSFATMDLMCSPQFERTDLGKLREVIWHAQCMGRIGNLVSTWQREINDRDFTSGVFARALSEGDVTLDDLRTRAAGELESAIRRGGHEEYFLARWEHHRRTIQAMRPRIRSFDVNHLLIALGRLIRMELCSRGMK